MDSRALKLAAALVVVAGAGATFSTAAGRVRDARTQLPTLSALPRGLSDAWGKLSAGSPRILVYVDPGCPHCHEFVDSLLAAESSNRSDLSNVVVMSAGTAFHPTHPPAANSHIRWVIDSSGDIRRSLKVFAVPSTFAFSEKGEGTARFSGGLISPILDSINRIQGIGGK